MELLQNAEQLLMIVVIACLLVIMAMGLDLISGLNKAKQRGELRSSWGLKRTLSKFISYIGSLLIAAGVDLIMHLCHFAQILHFYLLESVPITTCIVAIFLMVVEFLSIREKADEKTKTEIKRVAELVAQVVSKDDIVEAITQAIKDTHTTINKE